MTYPNDICSSLMLLHFQLPPVCPLDRRWNKFRVWKWAMELRFLGAWWVDLQIRKPNLHGFSSRGTIFFRAKVALGDWTRAAAWDLGIAHRHRGKLASICLSSDPNPCWWLIVGVGLRAFLGIMNWSTNGKPKTCSSSCPHPYLPKPGQKSG